MPPVVLAWALLFVVAFSLVYRFFAWVSRRSAAQAETDIRQAPSNSEAKAVQVDAAPVEAPAIDEQAPPLPRPSAASHRDEADVVIAPRAATAETSETATARDLSVVANIAVPAAELATAVAVPAEVSVASAELSPLSTVVAAAAAASMVRSALAPNVAATIGPREPLKPSVEATLPPRQPAAEPAPEIAWQSDISPAAVPIQSVAPASPQENEELEAATADEAVHQTSDGAKSLRLRARRIGMEMLSLDSRLRDSRERKIRRAAKTLHAATNAGTLRVLRVLAPKTRRAKVPARRIGQNVEGPLVVLLTKRTETKIVGGIRPPLRVLFVPSA